MTISSQSIATGHATLNADVVGSGDPVVFLHAAVADTRMWTAQMAGISSNIKAIAYDRRGFGRTIYAREDYSSTADLMAVLDGLGDGRPAVLVGCSQGGRIALDAALGHPSRVRGLVLIAPNVPGAPEPDNPPEIERLLAEQKDAIDAGDVDRLNAIKVHLWLDGPLQSEGRVRGRARELLLDMNSIVLRSSPAGLDTDVSQISPAFSRLAEIAMPSLMIWGDLDFPYIQKRCRIVADKMVNCCSLVLSGSAHLPSLDRPDDVTAALVNFIARCVYQS
jgi:pimeloyl-ACP methyl ester carboxylesterase